MTRLPAPAGRGGTGAGALLVAIALLGGCASTARVHKAPELPPGTPYAIHVVEAGQTLYRIALVYGVEESAIAKANGIADPRELRVGQKLIIPGATMTLEVPPYPAPLPPTARDRIAAARPRIEEWRPPPSGPDGGAWTWPIDGRNSSGFGAPRRRHEHSGIDLVAPAGTPILASREGRVIFAGRRGDYGQLVIIDHGDGWSSRYAHASKILVATGDRVRRGEEIARAGRSGRATTDHLHFEIRYDGEALDPALYLPPRGGLAASEPAPHGGEGAVGGGDGRKPR